MADKIIIKVLEDGTIRTETDKVSAPNHGNAESFLRKMFELAGGFITRKAKHSHTHAHGHEHTHEDEHEHTHQ